MQVWKIYKIITDIMLFAMSAAALSGSCMSGSTYAAYTIYLYFIALVFMVASLCEFVVYNHERVKKIFKHALCCGSGEVVPSTSLTKEEKEAEATCRCIWCLLVLPVAIAYFLAYVLISGARLLDIRQCFWRHINYNLNNFLSFLFKVVVYIYSIAVIIAALASCSNGVAIFSLILIGKCGGTTIFFEN